MFKKLRQTWWYHLMIYLIISKDCMTMTHFFLTNCVSVFLAKRNYSSLISWRCNMYRRCDDSIYDVGKNIDIKLASLPVMSKKSRLLELKNQLLWSLIIKAELMKIIKFWLGMHIVLCNSFSVSKSNTSFGNFFTMAYYFKAFIMCK